MLDTQKTLKIKSTENFEAVWILKIGATESRDGSQETRPSKDSSLALTLEDRGFTTFHFTSI
jgi:hypothetical protein